MHLVHESTLAALHTLQRKQVNIFIVINIFMALLLSKEFINQVVFLYLLLFPVVQYYK